jgi:hypothetical protein
MEDDPGAQTDLRGGGTCRAAGRGRRGRRSRRRPQSIQGRDRSGAGIGDRTLNEKGKWVPVQHQSFTPEFPETDIVFYQPHFVEYIITFDAVKTKGIRIIGDTKVETHWNKYTKFVSSFTSITELSVYSVAKTN